MKWDDEYRHERPSSKSEQRKDIFDQMYDKEHPRKEKSQSPVSRSSSAFPADYRLVLEASDLPIEVAVAIADRLDAAVSATADSDKWVKWDKRMLNICRGLLDDGLWQSYDRREDVRDAKEYLDGVLRNLRPTENRKESK